MYVGKTIFVRTVESDVEFDVEKTFNEVKLLETLELRYNAFFASDVGATFKDEEGRGKFKDACTMFFTGGFWGANKEASLIMTYKKIPYDLKEIFQIIVIKDSKLRKDDNTTLTCTRMALLMLPRAYELRRSAQYLKSPIRKKVMAWKKPEDLEYVFVEGYKIFLKVNDAALTKEMKLRIMGINAAAAHKTAKKSLDILSGVADSFEKVCELSALDPAEVAEVIETNISLTGTGGAIKELFMRTADQSYRPSKSESDDEEDLQDSIRELLALGLSRRGGRERRLARKEEKGKEKIK